MGAARRAPAESPEAAPNACVFWPFFSECARLEFICLCVCVCLCVWVGTRYTAAQPAEDCAEPAQRQREKGRANLLILNLFFRASDPIRISEMSLNSTARPTAQPRSGRTTSLSLRLDVESVRVFH